MERLPLFRHRYRARYRRQEKHGAGHERAFGNARRGAYQMRPQGFAERPVALHLRQGSRKSDLRGHHHGIRQLGRLLRKPREDSYGNVGRSDGGCRRYGDIVHRRGRHHKDDQLRRQAHERHDTQSARRADSVPLSRRTRGTTATATKTSTSRRMSEYICSTRSHTRRRSAHTVCSCLR